MPSPFFSARIAPAPFALAAALVAAPSARAADENPVKVTDFDQQKNEPNPVRVMDLGPTGSIQVDTSVSYLNIGPILTLAGGYHHATGLGLEASYVTYPTGRVPSIGYGPLLQLQMYDGKYFRGAAGGEIVFGPVGLELGVGFRQGDDVYASTFSPHVAEFLSIGYFSFAFRQSVAVIALPTDAPSFGFETAFTFGLKLPVVVHGDDPTRAVLDATGRKW